MPPDAGSTCSGVVGVPFNIATDDIYYISLISNTDGTFTCSAQTTGPYAGVC